MRFNWFHRKPPTATAATPAATGETVTTPLPAVLSVPTDSREATWEELQTLSLVDMCSDEDLVELSLNRRAEFYPAGSLLFRRGEGDRTLFFLLQGTVLLEPLEGHAPEVVAGTREAGFPLNAGNRHAMSAFAKTDIWVLRTPEWEVSKKADTSALLDVAHLVAKYPALGHDSLFFVFADTFNSANLKLPAIPMVVHRLRQALAERADVAEAARILQAEPVLAAKIMEIANSPVFRTTQPVSSCLQAMSLLGVEITLNIVTGLCISGLYLAKKPYVRACMQRIWKQSIYVSALSSELAKKTRGVSPDQALLAGLFSYIGTLPFLNFLDEYPDSSGYAGDLDTALEALNGPVGVHLLRSWGIAEEIAGAPVHITDWFRNDPMPTPSLADVLALANWHSRIGQPSFRLLPPLASLPAYAKLEEGALDPEMSLAVLSGAKEEVRQLCRLLG